MSDWKENFGDSISIGKNEHGKPWAYASACFSNASLRAMVFSRIEELRERIANLQHWFDMTDDSNEGIKRRW